MDKNEFEKVSEFINGGRHFAIYLDRHGKWSVGVNGVLTQKSLVAKEIVRYLANALEGK